MAARIWVGTEHFAVVDDADIELVDSYRWYLHVPRGSRTAYAYRTIGSGRIRTQFMHRFITGYAQTDHINGNGLDNRRSNLRSATDSQNVANQPKRRGRWTSMYKGVSWDRASRKWLAQISCEGKKQRLGVFTSELEAALAYDAAARELFGEFANTNYPDPHRYP